MHTNLCGLEIIDAHDHAKDGDLLLIRSRVRKTPLLGIWTSDSTERFFTVLRAQGENDLALPQKYPTRELDESGLAMRIPGTLVPNLQIENIRFDTLRAASIARLGVLSLCKGATILGVARDPKAEEVFGVSVETGSVENRALSAMGFASWSVVCKDARGQLVSICDYQAPALLG